MATIETRPNDDGSKAYRVKIRLKGHPTQYTTFARLTDAKRWGQSTEAAIRDGRYFKTSESRRHTVAEVIDRYLLEVLPLRPKNASNTGRHLRWWRREIGHMLLSDVGPAQISKCRNDLLSTPSAKGKLRSPATVLRYIASMSHAFTIAMKDWVWVGDNPVSKITKPRAARGRERFLSDEERRDLLAACRESTSNYLHTVVVIAISTGMRRGEIMGMQWSRVDLERKQLILTATKNDTSRTLPIVSLAFTLLSVLHAKRDTSTDLVFPGNDPQKPVDLTKPWETAVRKAGLQDFRFHDTRHSAASYLAMNGATTVEIAAVLGHKTLQMVRRYSHLANSHTAKVVTAMNEKIFGEAV